MPPILVRVYGASRTLFNNASINVRVHDTTGRAHPKWKAIPDQVQTAGDLFDFELPEYLTGDEPIDVFQNPDKKKQRWLYVLSLFNREGKRLHGTVPYDRNQTETRHITIYLVASNGTVDDYVSFRMAIQPQVEGAPSWQNIGVLRRLGGQTYPALQSAYLRYRETPDKHFAQSRFRIGCVVQRFREWQLWWHTACGNLWFFTF